MLDATPVFTNVPQILPKRNLMAAISFPFIAFAILVLPVANIMKPVAPTGQAVEWIQEENARCERDIVRRRRSG